MKTLNPILIAATIALASTALSPARAQSQAVGPDGITASPKVRAMLDERRAMTTVAPALLAQNTARGAQTEIAASPKVRQMLNEKHTSVVASDTGLVASYSPAGADGVTASPKLREQLNERPARFEIAPLK